jgi:hypothetical protein
MVNTDTIKGKHAQVEAALQAAGVQHTTHCGDSRMNRGTAVMGSSCGSAMSPSSLNS